MIDKRSVFAKIKRKLGKLNVDALLVSSAVNIRYLTGFFTDGAVVLILQKGEPVCFFGGMNASLAKKFLKNANFRQVSSKRSVARDLADFLKNEKIKTLGFNDANITVEEYNKLLSFKGARKIVSCVNGVNLRSILADAREIKTAAEIKILRKAAKITVQIWKNVAGRVALGMTELEIARMIDSRVREKGYENSFQTIAAIGENTAYPHAIPTSRRLKKNEHLLVDFGIKMDGYCSDLTRTLYNGRMNPQIRDFRKFVLKAQKEAIKKVKPGVLLSSISSGINELFSASGVGEYVLHGAGHGVGCEVHEEPFFRVKSKKRFKKGMIVTIEPGLYKVGAGGVRNEDMILVTEMGNEVLTG
ncbi:MAG: aminopeptidase P family protein [Candidatus Omnitrophica bacterium]|nr:aminopeptidase P family protein [Candidatus Omnitrophota bacterium]